MAIKLEDTEHYNKVINTTDKPIILWFTATVWTL